MKQHIYIIICFICSINKASAQDPHFSQYFNLPLTINPASTGNFYNPGSFVANFRQQWRGIGQPYVTGYMNGQFKLLQNNSTNENRLGAGIAAMYDESLGGGLKTSMLSTSIAYNINLSQRDERSLLGVGLGFNYFNRRIDYSRLNFQQQFTSGGFDTNIPTGESALQSLKAFFDVSAGLSYTYSNSDWNMNVGIGAFHLNKPRQSALFNDKERVLRRFSAHGMAEFPAGFYKNFQIHGLHTWQGNVSETTVGAGLTWIIDDRTDANNVFELETLLFYRVNDAVYPYVGLTFSDLYFGVSYDITTSSLGRSVIQNRSIEFSLRYFFPPRNK